MVADKEEMVTAVNDHGQILHPVHPDGTVYRETVTAQYGEYIYKAEKQDGDEDLCVYIP